LKRIFTNRLFYICLICIAFSAVFLFAARHLFSDILRHYALQKIAAKTGFSDIGARLRDMDFSSADFSSIHFGNRDKAAISLKSFRVDYSIFSFISGMKLKRISLSGLEINCVARNGNFKLRDFNPQSTLSPQTTVKKTDRKKDDPFAFLKYLHNFKILEISNASFNIETADGSYSIPFNMKIMPAGNNVDVKKFSLDFSCREQMISLSGIYDISTGKLSFTAISDEIRFSRFQDISEMVEGLYFSGRAEFRAAGEIFLNPLKIKKFSADLYLRNASLFYSGIELKNSSDDKKLPLHVKVRGVSDEIEISAENFSFTKPLPLSFQPLKCKIKISGGAIEMNGEYGLAFGGVKNISNSFPMRINKPFTVKGVVAGTFSPDGGWSLKLADEPGLKTGEVQNATISTEFNGNKRFLSLIPVYEINAEGKGKDIRMNLRFKLPDVKISDGKASFSLKMLDLRASAKTENNKEISAETSLKLEEMLFSSAGLTSKTPEISFSAKSDSLSSLPFSFNVSKTSISYNTLNLNIPIMGIAGNAGFGKKGFTAKADFILKDAVLNDTKSLFHVSGINSKIPLKWPCPEVNESGNIRLSRIGFGETNCAGMNVSVKQNGKVFLIDGNTDIQALPAVKFNFKGKAGIENETGVVDFKFSIPECRTETPVDLGLLHPAAQEIFYNGDIAFDATFKLSPSGMKSSLAAKLRNTRLEAKKLNCVVDGIDLDLNMPRFLRFKSAPKQIIKFKTFSLGKINASKGTIQYQIEAADLIFIEKCSLKWCDGNVYTHALRFVPGVNDYELTLYCDNISLAKLLEQFGAAKAEGKGSLNGKIPLKIEKGNLSFEEGFFISTPGEGGSIHLSGSEIILDSISKGMNENIEVEIAKEALRNFDYDWAKLYLTTEAENLLIRMSLNGKPSKMLPFTYKKELGHFVRAEVESQGSKFQGIKLDVNFRLPINKILEYSKGTKNLLDKF